MDFIYGLIIGFIVGVVFAVPVYKLYKLGRRQIRKNIDYLVKKHK